jgi:cellulose synthase/poly-beta-1,6-N-acetylglucosamine synthase-like glycosyltransferase
MALYLVTSDIYSVRRIKQAKSRRRWHLPTISVVVPAHNEATTIERCLKSLVESNYPAGKLEVIVANDGSTDNTADIVLDFKKQNRGSCKIRLINRPNRGKAMVLNYAMRRCARGSLVMCLDSDSYLAPNALRNAAQHFRDRKVVAMSSNVNIIEDGTLMALVQRFEYLVCYQMKKGQALLDIEYIVGGIGSMFRRSMVKKVSYYDTNTMTEDIDLTMKIIGRKDRKDRIAYASDSVAYTEPAHTVGALMRQRYRWKYGRSQTFLKHKHMFFSRDKRMAKRLSWFMLPFAIMQDLFFFTEPFILAYFLYVSYQYNDTGIFVSACSVLTAYLLVNVWSTSHLSIKERLRLTYYAPPMYMTMYVLSFAEYYALIKAMILAPRLRRSITQRHFTWRSPERRAVAS